MKPLRPDADWTAIEADRSAAAELQTFYEANAAYWHLTHGRGPAANEAEVGFDARPPADMSYTALPIWLIREAATGSILGEVAVATDLLTQGVMHLGFFLIASERHGTGLAKEVYCAYEAWAMQRGARWLRLGVVECNARAYAFWRRNGYDEVKRVEGYVLGKLAHTLVTMVKPMPPNALADYLAAVRRDQPAT